MLGMDPVDSAVAHVVDENVVRVAERRQNRLGVLEECRMPIVRVAAEEAVEVLEAEAEAEAARPLVEWAGLALLPVGNQVVLAEPRRSALGFHRLCLRPPTR